MRMRTLSTLILLVPLCACRPEPAALTRADRARITGEVEATVADLYDAMNAHDAARVMAHYLPGDDFLYAGVSSTVQGSETLGELTTPWYATHADVAFTYELLHVQVLARDVATVTVSGSSDEAPALLWTRTLVRRDGAWLVALEHESWPGAAPPQARHPMSP